jgi:hypothetical protein
MDSDKLKTIVSYISSLHYHITHIMSIASDMISVISTDIVDALTDVSNELSGAGSEAAAVSEAEVREVIRESNEIREAAYKLFSEIAVQKAKKLKPAEPGSEAAEPGSEAAEPGSEAAEPGSEAAEPGSEAAELGSEAAEPGSEAAEPGSEAAEPGSEAAEPGSEAAELGSEAAEPANPSADIEAAYKLFSEEMARKPELMDSEECVTEPSSIGGLTINDILNYRRESRALGYLRNLWEWTLEENTPVVEEIIVSERAPTTGAPTTDAPTTDAPTTDASTLNDLDELSDEAGYASSND